MADRVFLSLWVRGYGERNMLDHLSELLTVFPFSRLRQGIRSLEIYAVEYAEPPLMEAGFDQDTGPADVIELAREHASADVVFLIEGFWEMWQWDGQWKLAPAPVSIECFGPDFTSDSDDHLRLCLGGDEDFLLRDDFEGACIAIRSNIRGLLRLVEEIAKALPLARRRLWLESGENIANRLRDQLD